MTLGLAVLWPLLRPDLPPLQDLPNHLARVFVLLHDQDPYLAPHFSSHWRLVPNLAWDVFGVVSGRFIPLDVAARLFIALSLGLTIAGTFALNRALVGRWTWAPLLTFPFLFHAGYTRGFLSFDFGVGLALLASAWWAALPEDRWGRRLLVATLFSLLLYFSHLVAWGAYGLFVLATALVKRRDKPTKPWLLTLLRDGSQAVPPVAMHLVSLALVGRGGTVPSAGFADFEWPWQRLFGQAWHLIDTGAVLPGAVGLCAMLVLGAWLVVGGQVRFERRGLAAAGLLLLLFFFLPNQIYGTWYVAWRLALFAVLFMIAAATPAPTTEALPVRFALSLTLVVTLFLSAWQGVVYANTEGPKKQFLDLISRIPPGGTLFASHAGLDIPDVETDRIGLYHFGAWAVTDRKVMVQSLFSNPSQQPFAYKDPDFQQPAFNGTVFLGYLRQQMTEQGVDIVAYLRHFDWIVTHGPPQAASADIIPSDSFHMTRREGDFALYCKLETVGGKALCPDGREP